MNGQLEHAGQHHVAQQRREWVLQRAAWVVVGLILAGSLAGAFGKGPLSRRTLHVQGLTLTYDRIVRFQDQIELRVRVEGGASGVVSLEVGDDYLSHVELKSVVPEPEEQRSRPGVVELRFRPARAGEPVEVSVRVKVEKVGTLKGSVSAGAGVLRFEQFCLP
jgi:hypothetical protein